MGLGFRVSGFQRLGLRSLSFRINVPHSGLGLGYPGFMDCGLLIQ